MKKTISLAVLMIALLAFTAEKKFRVDLTEKQASRMFNDLANIQKIVDNSPLPHDQVKYIVSSIDSIRADMLPQISKQIDSTSKK
jgi:hypothetical protein